MRISVITVCYNCVNEIEKTILSVVHQTAFDQIEYIVVDGKSTDGTCDIISKYEDKIDTIISEQDKGIYDAMNKGIEASNGDFIVFMNAGDVFYDDTVCEKSLHDIGLDQGASDVYYGDVVRKKDAEMIYMEAERISLLRYRMPFSHQSCFINSSVMKKYKYNTKYKISADFNFFHILFVKNASFRYLPYTISVFEALNGVSTTRFTKSNKEMTKSIIENRARTWLLDATLNIIWGKIVCVKRYIYHNKEA